VKNDAFTNNTGTLQNTIPTVNGEIIGLSIVSTLQNLRRGVLEPTGVLHFSLTLLLL
jgi:hypothetical protein